MAKRSDRIHKRKDGRWEGRYPNGRKQSGELRYGSVYGSSYKEVKEKLREKEKQTDKYGFVFNKSEEKNFGEILDLWMENNKIRLKKGSLNKYRNLIDTHIAPKLGNIKASKLNSTLINSYLSDTAKNGRLLGDRPLSPSYVRSIMLVINAAIKFGVGEGFCNSLKSPINKPPLQKSEPKVLNTEEYNLLKTFLIKDLSLEACGVLIALNTGLRIGEICGLKWDDIDLNLKLIRVRSTVARVRNEEKAFGSCLIIDSPKTVSSVRDIPINEQLCEILKRFKENPASEYVISKTDGFVSPRSFEYRYRSLLKKSGIRDINFHALRHTFATRCIEAGVDVKSLSEILGHSSVGITLNTYVHSSMDMKRNQLNKLMSLTG